MYDKTADQLTKCPYYSRSQKLSITCEGIVNGAKNAIKFKTEEEKKEFQRNNCFKYHNNCNLKKVLEKKYEED